ncbi:ABC transporter substrate-binding protein [Shewanella sp. 202IG2-18]|uniref:ABC transporter substrate-binding protein n=1 Tax=Parashewanella hymeniacidonis TaxID=2807618 RepID=UPI0019603FB4|nr:ABC transporter substrate-binding protein [Parashewanella hymeniacidonis]MBM7073779.1 ABC transporter substrate-binding protein [Parashewanella hymeniacidonis]
MNNCLFRSIYRLVVSVTLISTLVACKQPELPSGLVYCSEGNPSSFNPQLVTSGTTVDATSHQLYDHLVEFDARSGLVMPGLAVSWNISADQKTYTFHLREGVQFHHSRLFTPTRTLNSQDVLFSFNRIIDKKNPFHSISSTGYPFFQGIDFSGLVKTISAPDETTVVFKLNHKDASFLANLASDFAVILSQEYATQLLKRRTLEEIDKQPIGTGPFVFKDYAKNEYIRYKRNEEYWGNKAKVQNLVFDITRKSSQRLAKLITRDCSVSALPKPDEIKVVNQNHHIELQQQKGMNVAYWAFNTKKAPFNNPKVRQALSLAINKKAILKAVYHNTASEAKSILPPASWAQTNVYNDIYNPVRARQLLKEAGVQNLEMSVWAMPTARAYNPNPIKTAQLLQADLALIGVRATIVSYDWSVFLDKLNAATYDSVLIGWDADNSDPDNFFSPFLSCASLRSNNNRSHWCNQKLDELLTKAKSMTSQQDRKVIYQQAEKFIYKQKPIVPLVHSNRMILKRADIQGVHLSPFGGISFAHASHVAAQDNNK